MLVEHSHAVCVCVICGPFLEKRVELECCLRGSVGCKAENIDCPALYQTKFDGSCPGSQREQTKYSLGKVVVAWW